MGNRLNVSHGGTPRTKRLSSLTGLEVKQFFSTSGRGRSIFLDIPLYRSGDCARNWFRVQRRFIDNHPFLASTQSASGEWFWIFSKQFLKLLFRPSLSPICVSRM